MKKIKLLNTYVNNVSMQETTDAIEALIHADKKSYVVAVNVDVIMKIEQDTLLKELTDKADMVLVDGKPLIWISKIHKKPKVSVCAGATVDFLAGNVKRAPKWMSEHGLEWFYRFLQEPKRMFKRYFVDDVKILGLVTRSAGYCHT